MYLHSTLSYYNQICSKISTQTCELWDKSIKNLFKYLYNYGLKNKETRFLIHQGEIFGSH